MSHNIKLRAAAKPVALAELEGEEILFIGPPDGELPTADDSGLIIVCSTAANPATVLALLDALDDAHRNLHDFAEIIDRLRTIEAAGRNLVKIKGRHHAEIAYQKLVEVLG